MSDFINLRQAASIIPGNPGVETVSRWARQGYRGRVLRTSKIGGKRWTTREWVEEFILSGVTPPKSEELATA